MSPHCKSCVHACKKACRSPCSSKSPVMGYGHHKFMGHGHHKFMGHSSKSPKCMLIKRCVSPKPKPISGCKWIKKCSPTSPMRHFSQTRYRSPIGHFSPMRHRSPIGHFSPTNFSKHNSSPIFMNKGGRKF